MRELNLRTRTKARYHGTRNSLPALSIPKSWRLSRSVTASWQPLDTHPSPKPPPSQAFSKIRDGLHWPTRARSMPNIGVAETEKYHHVPVHAASAFISSTTTGAMVHVVAAGMREKGKTWVGVEVEEVPSKEGAGSGLRDGSDVWDDRKPVDAMENWRSRAVLGR